MATRGCNNCGQTFDNEGNTVGNAIVAGCGHAGHLRSIPVQQAAVSTVSPRLFDSVYILCTADFCPLGTAFAVQSKSNELAVTCAHCICEPIRNAAGHVENVTVEARDLILVTTLIQENGVRHAEGTIHSVYILSLDWRCDLALLKLKEPGACFPQALSLCPSDRMPKKVEEKYVKLYHVPLSIFPDTVPVISAECFSNLKISHETANHFWVQVHTMPGSSGGPLVNGLGEVAGVVRTGYQPELMVSVRVPPVFVALVDHMDNSQHPDAMYIDRTDDVSDWSGHASTRLAALYTELIKIHVHGFPTFIAEN